MCTQIDSVIRKLEENPFLGKPLRGDLVGKWSIRVGDYRVIYTIDAQKKVVMLCDVGHMKKVYK